MPAGMAPTMFQPMQQTPLQGLQPLMGPPPDFGAAQRSAAAAMGGGFMGQAPPSFYPPVMPAIVFWIRHTAARKRMLCSCSCLPRRIPAYDVCTIRRGGDLKSC